MARPQTEEGFVMIALDLFVALMTDDLPNRDKIVLTEVLLQSYGPAKRRDVHLDPATIEHYTGLHRNNARAGIRSLVAAGYLVANPDGSFRFAKDYEAWSPKGSPLAARLDGGLVRFAHSALSRFGKLIKPSKRVAIQSNCDDNCKVNPVELRTSVRPQSDWIGPDVDLTGGRGGDVPPAHAVAASPEEKRDSREEDVVVAADDAPASPRRRSRPTPDPTEVEQVADWAEGLADQEELGSKVRQFATSYPLDWIEEAILCGLANARAGKAWSYAHGCLLSWHRKGGPDHAKIREARESLAAEKPGLYASIFEEIRNGR